MSNMTNVNIRMDADLKKEVEKLFSEFGINMTTAITMFAKATLREGKIPFEIKSSVNYDDLYNPYNLERLKKSIKQLSDGNVKAHELFVMEDD